MANKLEAEYKKEKELNVPKYLGLALGAEKKAELVQRVLFDMKQDIAARKGFLDKISEILDMYEGKGSKPAAFAGAATPSTRVVTMAVEILHAILFPVVWNPDLHSWNPVEVEDLPTADLVNKFMKWDASQGDLIRVIDDYVKFLILEGTVVTKTRWCVDWEWKQEKKPKVGSIVRKIKQAIRNTMTGQEEEIELGPKDFTIEYVPNRNEKCVSELIPLEDVGFPPLAVPGADENKLDHIWHRMRPLISELYQREARGFIEPGTTKTVEKGMDNILGLEGTAKERMDVEGSRLVDMKIESTPLEVVEWYAQIKLGDCYEDVVVWVEAKTETFLGATYLRNINKYAKRPFTVDQFIRRKDRMYGISMGELVYEYQKVLDEMQTINLNAGKLATNPPGFYRAASGFDPEKIVIQPGIMIPVDDINDVRWFQIPANTLPSHQEMRLILEMVERITSIGSYQSGQESNIVRSRSTARGTMALIAQGERRFVVMGKRMQYQLSKLMKKRLECYQQFMPSSFANRILGEDAIPELPIGMDLSDIAGSFDLQMSLDATGGAKSEKMELAQAMYEVYLPNPLVQQDPARVWEVSARPLIEAGEVNVERFIGPKPPTMEEQQQQMQEQLAQLPPEQQQAAMMAMQAQAQGQVPTAGAPQTPPGVPPQGPTPPAAGAPPAEPETEVPME